MNSTTNTTAVDYLILLQNELFEYMLTTIFILGIFSNITNIFVFLQKNLRSNPSSWYFSAVSMGHLIFLFFGCLPRLSTAWSGFDPTRTSVIFCKTRAYFLACGLLISRYFLCIICIDRWMITSSSVWVRRQSSLKVARWMIILGTSFWFIFSICMPTWYQIEGSRGCVGATNTVFPLFYAIYNLVTILGPLLIMIFFSSLVLINVRRVLYRQIQPTIDTRMTNGVHYHRKDIQLIKLSVIQGFVYLLFMALYAYNGTYAFLTQTMTKSPERVIIDGFITTIGINISYLYMATTFFLYSLVSKIFRKEFLLVCQRSYRQLFR